MGRQQLTLLDRATGRRVTVEVDPSSTTDELINELKRRGIVGQNETVIFSKLGNNGEEVPINSTGALTHSYKSIDMSMDLIR